MYLLDTNVFISAYQFHYGFDFHPGFWEWLIQANNDGRVFSIKKVHDEISRHEDPLSEWAGYHKDTLFLAPPSDIELSLKQIPDYLYETYASSDVRDFLGKADYYLIAYALSNQFTVVTHEVHKPTKAKIKIPKVCQNFKVECITPFEMLRQENARFVLDPVG